MCIARPQDKVARIEYFVYSRFERVHCCSCPNQQSASSFIQVPSRSQASPPRGRAARFYLWIYPNFMINAYEGVMDTNLVLPIGVDRCAVVFDYYFADISKKALKKNQLASSQRKGAG